MKKFLALILCIILIVPAFLVSCGNSAETVKFGAGVYVSAATATDATDDKDGSGKVDVTIAAVTVDNAGKIASCKLDTASYTVGYTADGKAVANADFQTKYELGAGYNMVAYGGAVKEWFEQADALATVVVGKTLNEVKALVAEGAKGTDEVINAGCTITISDFIAAIEKAYNAASAEVSADAALKINVVTDQTLADATDDKDGSNKISVNIFAAAVDANGKVLAAASDCVEASFTFNTNGASTMDTSKAIVSKKDQGTAYNMVKYGGATKEWFEQAAAFDAACIGKTTAEIAALAGADGKGNADLQAAGCTITVTGFVKAATKK